MGFHWSPWQEHVRLQQECKDGIRDAEEGGENIEILKGSCQCA